MFVLFFVILKTIDFSLKKYTRHHSIITVPSLLGLDSLSAQDTLDKYNLELIILDSASYNPNYNRGAILAHNPKPNSKVKPGRKIYLTINPLKLNYIPFPDLKNKSLRQAISLLESNAFRVGNLHYVDYFAKDVVRFCKVDRVLVNTYDSLPKFSIVDLYLGDGRLQEIEVPTVLGLEFHEIKRVLNNYSLNVGTCYFDNSVSDTLNSVIYKQEPIFSEKVPLGSYISVWLTDSVNLRLE